MAENHPNITLLMGIDPRNVSAADNFAESFVWHYYNPHLPDLAGDYVGVDGLKLFFENLAGLTDGTFEVNPVSMTPVGDELVVMHTRNRLTLEDRALETDVVVVWRIVEGQIAEVWDIPSVFAGVRPV